MQLLRKLCRHVADAELANGLLHFWIIGIRSTQLKCAGLLDQSDMLDAHRRFAHSLHGLSSFVFPGASFSDIPCMILISARCPVSTSVAKLKSSASCPAPAVANKSFTMISAPWWC